MILVTGATGTQGGAVVRHLREKGFAVRALTRHPEKPEARALINQTGVEVARGDYDDKPSLLRALEEVYGVFAVQTPSESGVEAEVRQGVALIDAAHSSEISHFIYSSVGSADQNTGIPHFDSKWKIEEHLRGTGMPYTIVRPVYFMENWLRKIKSMEEVYGCACRGGRRHRRIRRHGLRTPGQMAWDSGGSCR
ncbi:MAG: NmrA/HSCARG family protein [Bryobacteraceae bacterium]